MIDLYDISIEELDRRIQENRNEAAELCLLHRRGACDTGKRTKENNEVWFLLEQVRHHRTGVDPAPYRASFR